MSYDEINEVINNLNVNKKKWKIFLKNHFNDVYLAIFDNTKFLDETNEKNLEISFQERIYCIHHNLHERPRCIECGNHVTFRKDENRYREFCSQKCSKSSEQTKEKRENTSEIRYGSRNYNNMEKSRKTRYVKYGVKWSPDDFVDKVRQTNLRNHGDEDWNNMEKSERTNLERHGVRHSFELPEIQEKCRKTFLENHPGCKSTFDIPGIREKIAIGTRKRSWKFIESNSLVIPNFTEEEYVHCKDPNSDDALEFTCRTCGTRFKSYLDDGCCRPCPKCHPELKGQSEMELEVVKFLRDSVESGWSVLNKTEENRNVIKPKEIDIIVKDGYGKIRLLVEFDGLFYHMGRSKSENDKDISHFEDIEMQGNRI